MNVSLYQAASALNASARWQEVVSENLASSSIPGYKKQDLSFEAVQAGLMPSSQPGLAQQFALTQAKTATNFQPGELRATSVKTDVALEGKGFFTVQLPNGATGYTRDGEFQINSQGELVTKQGHVVLGDSGPIRLNLTDPTPLSISPAGEVSQGPEIRGKLRVVDFNKLQLLTPAGGGYFLAQNPDLVPAEIAQPSVRQGYLESANTSSIAEMASLISVMRGFEANQKVIQMQDERMARAISELGNPS